MSIGLQLLMLEQPDQPSSDSRGRKQLMATALQKSKSTLTDLLSKVSMYMSDYYFMFVVP